MASEVEQVRARIETILRDAGCPYQVEGEGLQVERGSCVVRVAVRRWMDRHTLVELTSPVLRGVVLGDELLRTLNELNEKLALGKAYWHGGELRLGHALLGDHLDAAELLAAVGLMTVVADHIDDELKGRFGGQRWTDPR